MNRKTVLNSIIALSLLVTAYVLFSYISSSKPEEALPQEPNEFEAHLAELQRLKQLDLDTTILDDSFFQGLREPRAIPPLDRETGRSNPFISP